MREKPHGQGDSPLIPHEKWVGGIEALEARALLSSSVAAPPCVAPPVTAAEVATPHVVRRANPSATPSPETDSGEHHSALDDLNQQYHPRTAQWNAAVGNPVKTTARKGHKSSRAVPHDVHRGPPSTPHTPTPTPTPALVPPSTGSGLEQGGSDPVTTPADSTPFTLVQDNSSATFAGPGLHAADLVLGSTLSSRSPATHLANSLERPVLAPARSLMLSSGSATLSPTLQLMSGGFGLFGPASQSVDAFSLTSLPTGAPGMQRLVRGGGPVKDWLTIFPQAAYEFADTPLFTNAAMLLLGVTATIAAAGITMHAIHLRQQIKAARTRRWVDGVFSIAPLEFPYVKSELKTNTAWSPEVTTPRLV